MTTNKKTALEQLKENYRNNHKVLGVQFEVLMQQAFAELAERVEALEAKTSLIRESFADKMIRLDERVRELANDARNEPPAAIELPDSVYNELFMACREGKVRPEYDYQYPLAERITIGSTTFIRAKKESK